MSAEQPQHKAAFLRISTASDFATESLFFALFFFYVRNSFFFEQVAILYTRGTERLLHLSIDVFAVVRALVQ